MDNLLTWYPVERLPTLHTDQRSDLKMIVELKSGYNATGEYDHATDQFLIYSERVDDLYLKSGSVLPDLDILDDVMEWVLEETEEVAFWMWIPRPVHT